MLSLAKGQRPPSPPGDSSEDSDDGGPNYRTPAASVFASASHQNMPAGAAGRHQTSKPVDPIPLAVEDIVVTAPTAQSTRASHNESEAAKHPAGTRATDAGKNPASASASGSEALYRNLDEVNMWSSPFQMYKSASFMTDDLWPIAEGPADVEAGAPFTKATAIKYLRHATDTRTLKAIPTLCTKVPACHWCGPRVALTAVAFLFILIGAGLFGMPDPDDDNRQKSQGVCFQAIASVVFLATIFGWLLEFVPDHFIPPSTPNDHSKTVLHKRVVLNTGNTSFNAFWLLIYAGALVRDPNPGVVQAGGALLFLGSLLSLPPLVLLFCFWHNSLIAPGEWMLTPRPEHRPSRTLFVVCLLSLFLAFTQLASALGTVYVSADNGGSGRDPEPHYNAALGCAAWVTIVGTLQAFFTVYVGAGTHFPMLSTVSSGKLGAFAVGVLLACIALFTIIFFGIAQE